jgi:hypothetical protein
VRTPGDHPSRLIREWPDYDDIDEVVRAMVEDVVRFNARRRLVELIE